MVSETGDAGIKGNNLHADFPAPEGPINNILSVGSESSEAMGKECGRIRKVIRCDKRRTEGKKTAQHEEQVEVGLYLQVVVSQGRYLSVVSPVPSGIE